MIEIILEFFFGIFSVTGAKKNKAMASPLFLVALVGWLVLIFSLTLVFG
ncbi:hypothetical protein [Pedobacter sp. Leaf176]|nr:hypothetical protein [Pedobacter sp. Leaf176]